jgi:hypothetical protein
MGHILLSMNFGFKRLLQTMNNNEKQWARISNSAKKTTRYSLAIHMTKPGNSNKSLNNLILSMKTAQPLM